MSNTRAVTREEVLEVLVRNHARRVGEVEERVAILEAMIQVRDERIVELESLVAEVADEGGKPLAP